MLKNSLRRMKNNYDTEKEFLTLLMIFFVLAKHNYIATPFLHMQSSPYVTHGSVKKNSQKKTFLGSSISPINYVGVFPGLIASSDIASRTLQPVQDQVPRTSTCLPWPWHLQLYHYHKTQKAHYVSLSAIFSQLLAAADQRWRACPLLLPCKH